MDTSFEKFEQYVRQEFVVVRKDLEKLEQGQQKLEKAIGDSQTRVTQWVVGLFVGTIVIITGLSSVLVTSSMLVRQKAPDPSYTAPRLERGAFFQKNP